MTFIFLVLLGIGLSFDTFAVSVSCGLIDEKIKFLQAVRISLFFAFFQALMPVLGYFLGYNIKEYIENIDHWLAFGLLSLLGLKMIWESFKPDEEKNFNPHSLKVILSMSLATTIDAFIVGISLAFMSVNLVWSALIIGTVTFLVAMLGMLFGKNIGSYFGKKIEILGGLILIAIGLKILLEHLAN
jgi:manganese efflux pump family protein